MSFLSETFRRAAHVFVGTAVAAAAAGGGLLGAEWAHEARQPELSTQTFRQETQGPAAEGRVSAYAAWQERVTLLAAQKGSADVQAAADRFAQDLRLSWDLSERDYTAILAAYDSKVGLAPSPAIGNVRSGIAYNHECHVQTEIFSLMDMNSLDEAEKSAEVGDCMAKNRTAYGMPEIKGGIGGAALGAGLVLVPALRRRKSGR